MIFAWKTLGLNYFHNIIHSSLEIIHVLPDPNIFLWIAASVADTAAINPNGIKTLLANGVSIYLIKGKSVFSNSPTRLTRNPTDCPIFCNWVFDNFKLVEELFAKAWRRLEIYALVNSNLCGKLFSSLELTTTFDESYSVTSVPFLFQILIY